jgi:hypothetical protein
MFKEDEIFNGVKIPVFFNNCMKQIYIPWQKAELIFLTANGTGV